METSSRRAEALAGRLQEQTWRLVVDPPQPGDWNMAVDQLLFDLAQARASPTLRLYGWQPAALSLGRFQPPPDDEMAVSRRRGWDVVRRPTGGRAVIHDRELTYSITLPAAVVGPAGPRQAYAVLAGGIARALCSAFDLPRSLCLGPRVAGGRRRVPAAEPNCFARADAGDIAVQGRKLVGSAQARSRGAILQHGSILLEVDTGAWSAVFGHTGQVVGLSELAGRELSLGEVPGRLVDALAAEWGVRFCSQPLTAAERSAAEASRPRFRVGS